MCSSVSKIRTQFLSLFSFGPGLFSLASLSFFIFCKPFQEKGEFSQFLFLLTSFPSVLHFWVLVLQRSANLMLLFVYLNDPHQSHQVLHRFLPLMKSHVRNVHRRSHNRVLNIKNWRTNPTLGAPGPGAPGPWTPFSSIGTKLYYSNIL